MQNVVVEAKVENGKIVPLKPIDLPEGRIIRIRIEVDSSNKDTFLKALERLKNTIKGKVKREEWYEQTDLY